MISLLRTFERLSDALLSDATRNNTSRWKNRAQRKPAEPGNAILCRGELSHGDKIVLRSNAFSYPGDRSKCMVVAGRGRSRKTVRDQLRTTHSAQVSDGSGDFRVCRKQQKFSRAESERGAM